MSYFREGLFEALLSAPRYLMNKILYKRQKVIKNKLIIWQQIKVNVDISNLLCQNFLLSRTFLNTKMLTNFAVCLNKPICVDLKHPLFCLFLNSLTINFLIKCTINFKFWKEKCSLQYISVIFTEIPGLMVTNKFVSVLSM